MAQQAWVAVAGAIALAGAPAVGGIRDVRVTTDRSIDCSSIQTIARDLYAGCKGDQEKAIATWYFVRRMLFHWPHVPTWDSVDLINSYGWGLCGYQSTIYCQIAAAGGLKARMMHPKNHAIAEVFYDGGWHMFDCQVGWYALNRKGKVASCAELKADPTLVTDAVKEGRASRPYFQCRDRVNSGTNYAATARAGRAPAAGKKRLLIHLRRGESITRRWSNEGKSWHKAGETRWTHPHHGCTAQGIDTNDPVNWPYWKPYAEVRRRAGERIVYGKKRYFGNGRMVYAPDLGTEAWADGVAGNGLKNIKPAAKPHPAEAGKPASVTFVIDSPYVAVDAWLDATVLRKTEKDAAAVYAKGKKGGWKKIWEAAKTGQLKLEKVPLKQAAWFAHGYEVKFEMAAGANPADVAVEALAITTVFMNNMYALPYLMPGKNVVRVTAGEGADLKTNPLTLEYVWEERGKDKMLTKRIDKLPFECTVNVAGEELPRMKLVKLSVAP